MPGRMSDERKDEAARDLRGLAEALEENAASITALLYDDQWRAAQRELMRAQRRVVNMHTACVRLENEEKWREEP